MLHVKHGHAVVNSDLEPTRGAAWSNASSWLEVRIIEAVTRSSPTGINHSADKRLATFSNNPQSADRLRKFPMVIVADQVTVGVADQPVSGHSSPI
jgi:hypothetical protein